MEETSIDKDEAKDTHPTDKIHPDYRIWDMSHTLSLPDGLISSEEKTEIKRRLLERIEADAMLPFYNSLCRDMHWDKDDALIKKLEDKNNKELEALEEAITDSKENYGDVEVKDALLNKAHFYCRIGDKEAACEGYEVAHERTVGAGGRLDIVLTLIRLGLFYGDTQLVKKNVQRAKKELETGGDWERRNKLKVYEGVLLMTKRGFKDAAKIFLDSIATFTATELLSMESFVFYTVVLCMVALDRPVLKNSVVSSPEILQVTSADAHLNSFMNSFVNCNYTEFMSTLVHISERVRKDCYLGRHYLYFIRAMRLRAYSQFLAPFKTVKLSTMSEAFGMSSDFLETDVADFIASGKLSCKIDRVGGVIESDVEDDRNALYHQTIKQGDALLNRIQKLSRVIDM